MYGYGNSHVSPEDLIAFAWSAPIRELAVHVGMTDVGLKKLLAKQGIVTPPQGYWNKLKAGRAVPKPPKPLPRGPGETGYISLDSRFASLPQATAIPYNGPFGSAAVPEDLERLRARELKAIGRAAAATRIAVAHPVVGQLLALDEKRRERAAGSHWHFGPNPLFESPYEKRRLRILNAIFLTVERRGHRARFDRRDDDVTFSIVIGNTSVGIELEPRGRRAVRVYGQRAKDSNRPAGETMELIAAPYGTGIVDKWTDDEAGPLESKISQIAAGIIVAGEAAFRVNLRKEAEQVERDRIEAHRRAEVARKEQEEKRVASLLQSGQRLAEAQHLRAMIASVEAAVQAGGIEISNEHLASWKAWAELQADGIDPVKSGQIFEHLPGTERPR